LRQHYKPTITISGNDMMIEEREGRRRSGWGWGVTFLTYFMLERIHEFILVKS
jgi:hypothetical protein